MPDTRRTRNYQPDLQSDLDAQREALSQWNPMGGVPVDRGMDPLYADRYLGSEGSQDTLRSLAEALQGAQGRTENIDAGLGRSLDLIQEQKSNMQPLFDQAQSQEPGLMSQLRQGMGSVGSAIGGGLSESGSALGRGMSALPGALQDGVDNLAMRFQRAHAIGQGTLPYYLQEQAAIQQMQQAPDLLALKRGDLAQKLQQQQMQRQQHLEDQVLGIWKDQNIPISMKKKLSEQLSMQGVPLAKNLMRLGDEQVAAEMETLAPHLPAGKLGELVNLMRQPNADLAPVEQWLNHARERKKAHGEAQMKSERFTSLLKAYQSGEMDPDGPDYDEFKQHVMEREKRQKEAAEMDLKLQQMGLTKRKAEMELQAQQVIPQYGPEVNLPGGNVQRDRFDPQTGQLSQVVGNKPPASVTNIDMKQESAYKTARGKDFAKLHADADASAISAQTRIAKLDRLGSLMKGFETGGLVPSMTAVQNIGETFGIKVDSNLPAKQAFEALSNELALMMRNTGEGNGMPGNMSNADREYLVTTVPSLGKSKGGNMKIIETARTLAQREVEKSKQMAAYEAKHGQLDSKFLAQWNDYVESHPMFPKVEQSSPKESKGAAPQTGPYSDPNLEAEYQKFKQEWKKKNAPK